MYDFIKMRLIYDKNRQNFYPKHYSIFRINFWTLWFIEIVSGIVVRVNIGKIIKIPTKLVRCHTKLKVKACYNTSENTRISKLCCFNFQ